MNCKDCIHYEICEIMSDQYGIPKVPSSQCGFYKNTADVVEVRHGEWREVNDKYPRYVCTVCNHLFNNKNYNYCPCCGAKMDGERREECKQEK